MVKWFLYLVSLHHEVCKSNIVISGDLAGGNSRVKTLKVNNTQANLKFIDFNNTP